jgi:hypothetical protein
LQRCAYDDEDERESCSKIVRAISFGVFWRCIFNERYHFVEETFTLFAVTITFILLIKFFVPPVTEDLSPPIHESRALSPVMALSSMVAMPYDFSVGGIMSPVSQMKMSSF